MIKRIFLTAILCLSVSIMGGCGSEESAANINIGSDYDTSVINDNPDSIIIQQNSDGSYMQQNTDNFDGQQSTDSLDGQQNTGGPDALQNTEGLNSQQNNDTPYICAYPPAPAPSFAEAHGALSVSGSNLVDKNGENIQLYGMSTHGLAWFPQFVSKETFATLRDDWNTNCVRLAMYTAEYGGYCTGGDRENLKNLVRDGVDYATELGMYVIVDWHILTEQSPNIYKQDAKEFFEQMSSEFADHENVIYEICNEPNGYASWSDVKSYAQEIIPCIRENDPDSVILVGTPMWSQEIDKALDDPLDFENIMYTLHFYAGTHKDDLRNRLESCVSNELPVFVSEFGMCDASGNGANDFDSTLKWLEIINENNISFMCWNLANKNESSSVIKPDVQSISDWYENDLSESGKWIREYWKNNY